MKSDARNRLLSYCGAGNIRVLRAIEGWKELRKKSLFNLLDKNSISRKKIFVGIQGRDPDFQSLPWSVQIYDSLDTVNLGVAKTGGSITSREGGAACPLCRPRFSPQH